jgi:hypothetical protein
MTISDHNIATRLFEYLGFECQAIGFDRVFADPSFQSILLDALRYKDEVAQVLTYLPDLIAIHRTLEPSRGSMFVRLFEDEITISEEECECYVRFYPARVLILFENNNRELFAEWFGECKWDGSRIVGELRPLRQVLEKDVGIPWKAVQENRIEALGLKL